MLLPFYGAEEAQDPTHKDSSDPSIKKVVEESQKEAFKGRRILGILLPTTHRPTVVPYSWR